MGRFASAVAHWVAVGVLLAFLVVELACWLVCVIVPEVGGSICQVSSPPIPTPQQNSRAPAIGMTRNAKGNLCHLMTVEVRGLLTAALFGH